MIPALRRLIGGRLHLVALALLVAWMARSIHENGHGWGDDFALYINQARGLSDGTLWDVVADNRFGLANSAWDYYSPIAYPWLFPLLLMPIVSIWGIDFAMLKWIPTLAFVGVVLATLSITRRRLDPVSSTLVASLVALNPWFLSGTDAVLSDLVFLAAVLGAIVCFDRAVEQRLVLTAGWGPMICAGLMIAAAFHIRREALGLALALAAVQMMEVRSNDRAPDRRAVAMPWVALIGSAGFFHLLLPAPLLATDAPGGGLAALRHHIVWYREPLAELIGLKEIGAQPISAAGSTQLGQVMFWAILGAAGLGIVGSVVALIRRQRSNMPHLVAALIGIGGIVLIAPYHYQRYIYTVAVIIPIVAAYGLRVLIRHRRRRQLIPLAALALFVIPLAQHASDTVRTLDYHRAYEYTHWGPDDPAVIDLFDAVERFTDQRDVIVFFQARSMNLFTGRLAIQGNNEQMMVERGDWYAQERDSDYIQTPLTLDRANELGFEAVWSNSRFILWRIPEFFPEIIDP